MIDINSLDSLNAAQRQAVTSPIDRHLLVLAGAGSGKTRVLTQRIGWLCASEGFSPHSVMAVTFTNKAAAEMRARLQPLLGVPMQRLWVGTFHSLAHRLLRLHWQEAGLEQNFQIIDSDDQLRMVKRIVKELGLDDSRWPPKQAQWFINSRKEEGRRSHHLQADGNPVERTWQRIYAAYEQACRQGGQVDFAELLLRVVELLRDNDSLREHYQQRFSHLLVDEFQDSNDLQYAWLRLLVGESGYLFAVGDDDQSIYGWRGAKVANLLNFERDFDGAQIVRLEQNYRSTGHILNAANGLISNNQKRLGKELWTDGDQGELLSIFTAYNEVDEARFVCERLQQWISDGGRRDEAAILYRSNAQSRVFEEALIAAAIPYRVYGGLRFFERAEIKDALAYLRMLANPDDNLAFERTINQPPRGIGAKTVETIRERARQDGSSLWRAALALQQSGCLKGRAATTVSGFTALIGELNAACRELSLDQQVDEVINRSGLRDHFDKDRSDKGRARLENLQELVGAAGGFSLESIEEEMAPLDAFLSHAALEAGEAQGESWEECVQLMTLHSAKGLEFPLVFLVGMEEGLFPHQRALDDPNGLEEERRLCYVGITRARQQVYLSLAEQRRLYGREFYPQPSRFIDELPAEHLQEIRPRLKVRRPVYRAEPLSSGTPSKASRGQGVGSRVRHVKFGEGVITSLEGSGAHARVQVNFADVGSKWLVLSYANLQYL